MATPRAATTHLLTWYRPLDPGDKGPPRRYAQPDQHEIALIASLARTGIPVKYLAELSGLSLATVRKHILQEAVNLTPDQQTRISLDSESEFGDAIKKTGQRYQDAPLRDRPYNPIKTYSFLYGGGIQGRSALASAGTSDESWLAYDKPRISAKKSRL